MATARNPSSSSKREFAKRDFFVTDHDRYDRTLRVRQPRPLRKCFCFSDRFRQRRRVRAQSGRGAAIAAPTQAGGKPVE